MFFAATPPNYFATVKKCNLAGAYAAYHYFTTHKEFGVIDGFILPITVSTKEHRDYCVGRGKIREIIWLNDYKPIILYGTKDACSADKRGPDIKDLSKPE